MIVSFGIRPPARDSSSSISRSLGSKAILFPPSKADPAWVDFVNPEILAEDEVGDPPLGLPFDTANDPL